MSTATAEDVLHSAAAAAGLESSATESGGMVFRTPRTRWYRQRRTAIEASLRPHSDGTEVTWNLGPFPEEATGHLRRMEAKIPVRRINYSGITQAALKSGARLEDRETLRALANLLPRGEVVLALGRGVLDGRDGWVLLTNHHLTFVSGTVPESVPTLQISLRGGVAILFGKKTTGETLTITDGDAVRAITGLGHGEGHLIITQARAVMDGTDP